MSRIGPVLRSLAPTREKALAVFLTAGVPSRDSTTRLVLELEEAGTDIIEIGLPFSDPLADGPVIQRSSALALRNGVTLATVLGTVEAIRKRSGIPLVLMGYLNPLLSVGFSGFCASAASAGVDGMILPEIPLEEHAPYRRALARTGLDSILLVTPASTISRIRAIDEASSGFLYCVALTGVTGAQPVRRNAPYIRRVKRNAVKNPVLAGFGIATMADARAYAGCADGIVVGSAFVRRLLAGDSPRLATRWIAGIKAAISG